MVSDSLAIRLKTTEPESLQPCPFGHQMRDTHFLIAPNHTQLNHGSFGTHPKPVQKRLRECQDLSETRPDTFQRFQYPVLLDENRAAIASLIGVPTNEVVFCPNASTALNVVLQSLRYSKGDVILHLSTVYSGIAKTIEYLIETTDVVNVNVPVEYPLSDDALVSKFQEGIKAAKARGNVVRVAVFDTISSLPGVRVPWERLVDVCKEEKVLSLVDGAHGVGQIKIDLAKAEPDFFTSNLHKWLYVPRGCAVFYVPKRNQHLIRTSFPTSHGFKPLNSEHDIFEPLMGAKNKKSYFEMLFEFVATLDICPYLCVTEALRFMREVCGGEEKVMNYRVKLANEGGREAARIFGTEIMDNEEGTLKETALTNVRLPLRVGDGEEEIPKKEMYAAARWMAGKMATEYDMYAALYFQEDVFWTRLSGEIYLEVEDFAKGAETLKALCQRVQRGEYKGGKEAVGHDDVAMPPPVN